MYFASDNTSPAHPSVLDALARANRDYASSYGADPIMDDVQARIREVFEAPEAAVYLVATGSAANTLALSTYCPPWGAIYCHRNAHVEEDECGGPEFYTGGAKVVLIDGADAKMDPAQLEDALRPAALKDVHTVQPGMLSLSNVTERGAVYTAGEVAELAGIAKSYGMPVHLDGARLANALISSGASPAEMTWKAGVDVLSFGGTKNGLMGVEAVVLFDPEKAWELELRRKRGGHLFSKHRYLGAQMQAYLTDDLWLSMARGANAQGGRLAQGIAAVEGASLLHPCDANMIFAAFPRRAHRAAMMAGAIYKCLPLEDPRNGPDGEAVAARLVCSWCTTDEDVDRFLALLR